MTSANPTQAIAGTTLTLRLDGTGFIKGTVILVNGAAVSTTYEYAGAVEAKIPAPAGNPGSVNVQARNPAPGGGTGATFKLPVASLTMTATDPDGTNTGTGRLGVPVNFTTANTDALHSGRSWTLKGAGQLSISGPNDRDATYTPPSAMPANSSVTITSELSGLPILKQTYTLTLVNPIPTVKATTPVELVTGGTQSLKLTGAGFLPSTTLVLNGVTYPTTFIDYNDATVKVTVAANAAGTVTYQVKNPAPGGGTSKLAETVEPNSLFLTATNPANGDATNHAIVAGSLDMTATVTGSMKTAVNWSVTGTGTISASGVYAAPKTMPNNRAVTIKAALASNPAISNTFALTVDNPDPTITDVIPERVPAGATTSVTISGLGFVPSTVIMVNGEVVSSTFVTHHEIVAKIKVGTHTTGNLQLQAYTANFIGGTSDIFDLAITTPTSVTAAGRLLDQTTFGPTVPLIHHVEAEGVTAWLAEQFGTPQTFLPAVPAKPTSYCFPVHCLQSEWWQTAITANDQLRQRVAFALSEMFVVSTDTDDAWSVQQYDNMLARDAFSNWYTIMTDVTLSPAMGVYLNMLNSAKPTGTLIANENYARENMQLFNLGVDQLNQDGSLKLDKYGNPIATYSEAQVEAFARVFTGWTYANADGSAPNYLTNNVNDYHSMVAVESQHDENPKTLLNGTVLPAGQTAEQDLAGGLTNIFQHPNMPPFICKELIQHLVKSGPSPEYVARVAAIFANDGAGVRGNMQAVLTAIFTDPEARAGDTDAQASDGHLREPVLWMTGVMRGLSYVNIDPHDYWAILSDGHSLLIGQAPYESPSVFNFFEPGYVIPQTALNAPEFGLENTASVVDRMTQADELVFNDLSGFNVDLSETSAFGEILVSNGPAALVDELSELFLYGNMDANTAAAITDEINSMPNKTAYDKQDRVREAVYLVITSSAYKIAH